ncbi:MAG: beta-lactamase family protein [Planctomycetes bacterium]|jgi:CubicO group peptidase (beta-lactamase class C family)|nr:beta-lactamase family protein [Planctomycetota bacterium]
MQLPRASLFLLPWFAAALLAQQPEWLPKVEALLAARVQQPDAVGFSVGIAKRGQVLLAKGYGLAEAEHGAAATATTRFRIGSITKQFTAAAIMLLVEQQQLALDDELGKYVPEFPLQGKKVTIRQLLNHSSGIPSYTDLGAEWESKQPLELSHQELLALVQGKPFDFEPGTDWHYNNTGYYLLGMVLEKVHGKPYATVIRELVAPLGLEHTRCDDSRELIPGRAQGYDVEGGVRKNDALLGMSQPGAAGMMLSTGGDLVRWSMALAVGKVVQPASYAAMTTPLVLPNERDTGYGFGLMRAELVGRPLVMHGGGIHGFNSQLLHVVPDDLHIAVISNSSQASADKLAKDITRAVLGIEKAVAADLPIPAAVSAAAVGTFQFDDIGMALEVTATDGKLFAKGKAEGQGRFGMKFQGGREFRAAFDAEVKLVFSADWKQLTLHQGGGVFAGTRQ